MDQGVLTPKGFTPGLIDMWNCSLSTVLICPSKIVKYVCVKSHWVGTVMKGVTALMFVFV